MNNFAISSAGIGDALLNSAASMAAANNTLDETIALITAANTIVQDTSKVGNALKTVSMYLRAAKTEAEEAGESTDGMANSVSELRAELLALTGNKVDIQLDENTFKSTYQILKELSMVWDELTDISKANILESIAGKRQSNIVAAILQEFSIAEEVLGTAANAAGSALRENEEYLNSIQGKLDKFTATFQNLSSTFMSSEFFKGLIESGTSLMDLLTKLLDMMNKIADKFGSSGTLATIVGLTSAGVTGLRGTKQDAQTGLISLLRSGEFSKQKANFDSVLSSDATMRAIERYNSHLEKTVKFKTAYWKALKDSDSELGKYFKTLKGGQASLSGFRNYLIKTEILLKANSIAMRAAAAAATAFDMAINALSGVLATFAIQFAINKILSLISAEKDAAKEAKELADRAREAAIETSSEIKTLDDLIERYEQLGESGSINKESHAEVLDIQQQILDILGAEGGELDLINGKLGEQITKIKELAAAEDGLFSRAKDNALAAYARSVSAVEKAVGSTSGFLGALNYDYSGDRDNKAATILRNAGYWDYVYDGLGKTRILTSGSAEERAEILSGMIKALKDANYDIAESELFAAINEQYNEYVSLIDDQKLAAIDSITQVLNEEFLRKDISGIDINSIESYKELSDELVNIVSNSNDLSTALAKGHISIGDIENAVDSMMKSEYPEWYREVATSTGTFVAHLSSIKDLVDPLSSSYKLMSDALADVHDGGSLSATTLKALAEAEEDYIKYLTIENGQIKLNIDLWRERSKAQVNGNISDAEHEIESLENRNKQIREILSSNPTYDGQIMEGVSYEEWAKNIDALTLELESNSDKIKESYKHLEILKQILGDVFGPWQDTFSVYDAFATDAANLVKVDNILSDGLTMSTAKARELGDIYPEILSGATEAGNGMITLNAEVANNFVKNKHYELKASNEVEISKLEFEATLLGQKIDLLTKMRKATEKSNDTEVELYANRLAAITAMEEYIRTECEKTGVSSQDANAIATYAIAGDWESLATLVDDISYDMEDDTATAFKNIVLNSKQLASGMINNLNEVGEAAKNMYRNVSGEDLPKYVSKNLTDSFAAEMSDAVADLPDKVQEELNNLSDGVHMFRDGDNVEYINVKIAGEYLNNIKSNLAPYIQAYKNASEEAIQNEIDALTEEYDTVMGRIAILRAENENLLQNFVNGSSKSAIDEYIADIDRFRDALERLARVRVNQDILNLKINSLDEDIDGLEQRIALQKQLNATYLDEQDAILNLNSLRSDAIQSAINELTQKGFEIEFDNALPEYQEAMRQYQKLMDEVEQKGIDLNKTIYGNIDTNQRVALDWTAENIEKYRKALESWGENPDDYIGSYSTVDGRSMSFGNVEIAFTPMWINPETGDAEYLDRNTVVDYIHNLIDACGDSWTTEDLLSLDSTRNGGLGLIAGVGADAILAGEAMHYAGSLGAIADAYKRLEELSIISNGEFLKANTLVIKNEEDINKLQATSIGQYGSIQEATNELRKNTEEAIKIIKEWNDDNREEVNKFNESITKIREGNKQIVEDLKEIVTLSSNAVDSIQSVYDTLKSAADEYAQNGGFISVDAFQSVMELGPEYLAYLKDENGQLVINEDRIRDIIKAKKEQLAIDTARSYLGRLEQAMMSGSIEDLEDLIRVTDEATDSEWGLIYAQLAMMGLEGDLHQGALDTINAIRALSNSVGDIFDDTNMSMSDMVDGMNNLIDHVIDMRQHQLDQEVESLEEMKDAFGEIIELRQEALDKAKEENDYQKELTKKVKEIAKLQDRINTLSLDNSRSAQAEKARLEEEMAELQEELAETQTDKALEAQKESLDKMQESYEEQKNAEIKTLEESLDSQQEKWDDAISYIENNWGDLHDQLLAWNEEWGSSLNEEITKAFEAAEQMVKHFGGSFRDALAYSKDYEESNSGSSGSSGMSNNTIVGNTVNDSSYTAAQGVSSIIDKMKAEGQKWASTSSQEARDKIMYGKILDLANTLRKEYGIWAYRSGGAWYIDANKIGKTSDTGASPGNDPLLYSSWKDFLPKYHTGGIASGNGSLKQNEVLSILEDGEMILDDQKQKSLYRFVDFATYFSEKFGKVITNMDLAGLIPTIRSNQKLPNTAPVGNVNSNTSVHFGDVYISGASEETVAKHREVNRQFANEVLKHLNIKR